MRCAVFGCNKSNDNKNNVYSFHPFPKDKQLLKTWVHFCQRQDEINIKVARICGLHFNPEDFQNNMQYEAGFSKKRLLKKGAVPSFKVDKDKLLTALDVRAKEKQQRSLVEEILCSSEEVALNEQKDIAECPSETPEVINLKNELETLRNEITSHKAREKFYTDHILKIRKQLMEVNAQCDAMRSQLRTIFTEAQIEKLCKSAVE